MFVPRWSAPRWPALQPRRCTARSSQPRQSNSPEEHTKKSGESIGYKLAELQGQLKQHHSFNRVRLWTKAGLNEREARPPAPLPFNEASLCERTHTHRQTHNVDTSHCSGGLKNNRWRERESSKNLFAISFHCNYISLQRFSFHTGRQRRGRACVSLWSTPHFHIFIYSLSSIFFFHTRKFLFNVVGARTRRDTHVLGCIHSKLRNIIRWLPMTPQTWEHTLIRHVAGPWMSPLSCLLL